MSPGPTLCVLEFPHFWQGIQSIDISRPGVAAPQCAQKAASVEADFPQSRQFFNAI
jgi:hypothetical protein